MLVCPKKFNWHCTKLFETIRFRSFRRTSENFYSLKILQRLDSKFENSL